MSQSHYEINVAINVGTVSGAPRYVHLFATAERSCVTRQQFETVAATIKERFPAPQYNVSASYQECIGRHVEI